MLSYNPDERITAREALSHRYFQSFPLACEPYELPKVDQDCHTFLINNKRKGNSRAVDNTMKITKNQNFNAKKPSLKNQNLPLPNRSHLPMNAAPIGSQYNNNSNNNNTYSTYNQINYIDNINNINVNLFLPPTNPLIPQFYNLSFAQQIPYFGNPYGSEPINNIYMPPTQMDQGMLFNQNMFPVPSTAPSNNMFTTTFNTYPYFNSIQPPTNNNINNSNNYLNQNNLYQTNQDPNIYGTQNFGNEQYQGIERPPYFPMQEICRRENPPIFPKRRIMNDIDEFEPMDSKKRLLIDMLQPNN
jgi:hypothetical protein